LALVCIEKDVVIPFLVAKYIRNKSHGESQQIGGTTKILGASIRLKDKLFILLKLSFGFRVLPRIP